MDRSKINRRNGNALKISQQLPWSQPPAPVGKGERGRPEEGARAEAGGLRGAARSDGRGSRRCWGSSAPRRGRSPPKLRGSPRCRLRAHRAGFNFSLLFLVFNSFPISARKLRQPLGKRRVASPSSSGSGWGAAPGAAERVREARPRSCGAAAGTEPAPGRCEPHRAHTHTRTHIHTRTHLLLFPPF